MDNELYHMIKGIKRVSGFLVQKECQFQFLTKKLRKF